MSTLSDVMRLTIKFMSTKEPADCKALSEAYEVMTKEEENEVGGGCPWIMY